MKQRTSIKHHGRARLGADVRQHQVANLAARGDEKVTLKDSNAWLIASLLITTVVAPIVVWNFQQGEIEKLKLKFEEEKLQMEKNKQSAEMFEKLSKALAEQRQLYDGYTDLVHHGHTVGSFQLQRKRQEMEEKDQEINNAKEIVSRLTGKKIEYIKGTIPPLPPSGLRLQ